VKGKLLDFQRISEATGELENQLFYQRALAFSFGRSFFGSFFGQAKNEQERMCEVIGTLLLFVYRRVIN
jgi:hypothetical protein